MERQYAHHAGIVAQDKVNLSNVMDNATDTLTPAQQLVGRELPNGWIVEKLIHRPETATGGYFSSSYIVRSDKGKRAFLKAMDYRRALESPDPAKKLQAMTTAYNFERTILEKCKSKRLSRIVRVLDSGSLPPQDGDLSSVVQYLVFELARGDIRSFVDHGQSFETAWILKMTHQVAAALRQLHYLNIAHQDVKPSNVLVFEGDHSKLADLGRASDRDSTSPHDEIKCAGDQTYAPPELLYGHIPEDWRARRLGCDMYLLGSLVVFFCRGISMTHLLFKRLDKKHRFQNWGGTYSEVLPYLQNIFAQIIRELREEIQGDFAFANEIAELVKQLCNPDPQQRGHPKNIISSGNQYSLERYVSIFDRLAKQAEYSLTHRKPIRRLN